MSQKWMPPKLTMDDCKYLKDGGTALRLFDLWYDTHIRPLFANAVEVYGHKDCLSSGWHYALKQQFADNLKLGSTHRALLIKIEPIKEETAEDILRELISVHIKAILNGSCELDSVVQKAKAYLERKK